mmetsp:Transcript_24846/g.36649  ORF Transcript_24846/g.36649 Transcript_24846/m.36649 type:complete len:448 (+) Transcript_24846:88-1431(+)
MLCVLWVLSLSGFVQSSPNDYSCLHRESRPLAQNRPAYSRSLISADAPAVSVSCRSSSEPVLLPLFPAPETGSGCFACDDEQGLFVDGSSMVSIAGILSTNSSWKLLNYDKYGERGSGGFVGYSRQLGVLLHDDGAAHSPIYGWAADGFPVCGPFQSRGEVAVSCWHNRDYSTNSPTGCGADGERSCLLTSYSDPTVGVTPVKPGFHGPSSYDVPSGYFVEDFYFNSSCSRLGKRYMDEHNGHSHPPYGYHYHLTVDGKDMRPVFPYSAGPSYYGCLPTGRDCCSGIHSTYEPTSTRRISSCGRSDASRVLACVDGLAEDETASPTRVPSPAPAPLPTPRPVHQFGTLRPTVITSSPSASPTNASDPLPSTIKHKQQRNTKLNVLLGLGVACGVIVIVCCAILFYWHFYTRTAPQTGFSSVRGHNTSPSKHSSEKMDGFNLVSLQSA